MVSGRLSFREEDLVPEVTYGRNMEPVVRLRRRVDAPVAACPRESVVAWVQDDSVVGGAEISSDVVIRAGRRRNMDIVKVTPAFDAKLISDALAGSRLIVIGNIWCFDSAQLKAVTRILYSKRIPYVKYEHDYRELRRPWFSKRLFSESSLNVFLSPAHREHHVAALGASGICIPLAIDTEMFRPVPKIARVANTALVVNTRGHKAGGKLQKYVVDHPELVFVFVGDTSGIKGKNVQCVGAVQLERMPDLYSRSGHLVHILDHREAGERVVFEAALCGCHVVANSRVGHISWGRDLGDVDGLRDWLAVAPDQFWDEVCSLIQ